MFFIFEDYGDLFFYTIIASLFIIPYLFVKLRRKLWLPNISSKYVLITGCGSGFGYDLALKLDQMGCHVFAGCHSEKGETNVRKVASNRLITMSLDVTNQESINKCLEIIKKTIPENEGLWGIVNNAGFLGSTGRLEWLSEKDYLKTLDVNLLGHVRINNTFLSMIKKVKGRIVSMTSIYGRFSATGMPYNISKFAANAYADGLRRDMRMFDVSCSTIEPGYYKTPMTEKENFIKCFNDSWNSAPASVKTDYEAYYKEVMVRMKTELLNLENNSTPVVDAMIHALFACYPKDRYTIGHDCDYVYRFLVIFPDWLTDFLFDHVFRIYTIPQAFKMTK